MKRPKRAVTIVGGALLFAATACGEPEEGDRCDRNEQTCNSDNVKFRCEDGSLVKVGQVDESDCDCIEGRDVCYIIGYVGVSRSGRARVGGRRLRAGGRAVHEAALHLSARSSLRGTTAS